MVGVGAVALALGLAAAWSPLAALCVIAVGLFVLAVCRAPYRTALVLGFLTAAFPKAGVKVAGFPFPVFLFGLTLAVLLLVRSSPARRHTRATTYALVLLLAWVASRVVVLQGQAAVGNLFAYAAWAAIPAALLYLATQVELPDLRWRLWIERGFMLACVFGLVQQAFGVEQTAVPGLTIAYGDSYASKFNVIYGSSGDFTKIMSTYQNGNIFSVTAAVFVTLAVMRITRRAATRHDYLLLVLASTAMILAGSRTGLVALAVGLALIGLRGGSKTRKVGIVGLVAVGYFAVVEFLPALAERYSVDGAVRSGAAGRTDIWARALDSMSLGDWLLGTPVFRADEGGAGLFQQHGIVGLALIVIVVVGATGVRREWRLPFAVLAVAALIDTSYALFPTWFIPAALAACPIVARSQQAARLEAAPEGRHRLSPAQTSAK